MKGASRTRLSLLAIVVSAVVSVASAAEMVGQTARLVDVICVFFGGVAMGASIASTVVSLRVGRERAR